MESFLEAYKLPKLNQEEIESLNRSITSKVIESVTKNIPTRKILGPDGFTGKFYQTFKKIITNSALYVPELKERNPSKFIL